MKKHPLVVEAAGYALTRLNVRQILFGRLWCRVCLWVSGSEVQEGVALGFRLEGFGYLTASFVFVRSYEQKGC